MGDRAPGEHDDHGLPSSVLALGAALLGATLVAWDVGQPRSDTPLPADAIAVVDGVPILEPDYERALAAVRNDRREPELDAADRDHVLERLIDQELLLGRAIELGLPRSDPAARSALVTALVSSIVDGAELNLSPTDAELRAHYQAHPERFRVPALLRVETLFFREELQAAPSARSGAPSARERAHLAHERLLAGAPWSGERASADAPALPLPDAPLPPGKLLDYLGATATERAFGLEPGVASEPLPSAGGYLVLRVTERVGGQLPRFEEVRPRVVADHRRRAGEQALRRYLDQLGRQARVVRRPPAAP